MQPVDPSQLLNVLQSPMGAAMLPQLAQQNGLAMDQGRASLADTIARTGIAQDSNRRSNEMHPLEMDSRRVTNEGQVLRNKDNQFDLGVKETLGQDHYVKAAQNKLSADDMKIAEAGMKQFSSIAGIIDQLPKDSAPGMRRQVAGDLLKQYRLPPSMIDMVNKMPEEQLSETFRGMAEQAGKLSRQYLQADRAADAKETVGAGNNATSIRVAEINAKAKTDAAALIAAAKRSASSTKPLQQSMEQLYSMARRNEISAQSPDEKAYWAGVAAEVAADMQNKPAAAGATAPTIVTRDGKPRIEQAPKVQPRPVGELPARPAGMPAPNMAPTKENAARLPQNQPQPKPSFRFENGKLVPVN